MHTKFWFVNVKRRDQIRDESIVGITLKLI